MMKIALALAALLCAASAAPLQRTLVKVPIVPKFPIFFPPVVVLDKSTAVGGPGGPGGSATATGAIVTGGIGGSGVSGDGKVFNKGKIVGGDGIFAGNVANGAAGVASGKGATISGTFTNQAIAGPGGPGGPAFN